MRSLWNLTLGIFLFFTVAAAAESVSPGFTPHFKSWLEKEYPSYSFDPQVPIGFGGYGGKSNDVEMVENDPVVFVHGAGDVAIGNGIERQGWSAPIQYFLGKGYRKSELYAMTWGDGLMSTNGLKYHSKFYLTHVRAFIEAVLQYTGARKIDVVSHSMGVTLARKAIRGGYGKDLLANPTEFDLGPSLSHRVDTFVGIAGGNRGFSACRSSSLQPSCARTNGFYPGTSLFPGGPAVGISQFLYDLDQGKGKEGQYVYAIWSTLDEVIGLGTIVNYESTCRIPGQDGEKVYSSVPFGHLNSAYLSGPVQLGMIKSHQVQ